MKKINKNFLLLSAFTTPIVILSSCQVDEIKDQNENTKTPEEIKKPKKDSEKPNPEIQEPKEPSPEEKAQINQDNSPVKDENKIEKTPIYEPEHKEHVENSSQDSKNHSPEKEVVDELKIKIIETLNGENNIILVKGEYGKKTANETYRVKANANLLVDFTGVIDSNIFTNIPELKGAEFYISKYNKVDDGRGFIDPSLFTIKTTQKTFEFQNIRIQGFKQTKPELAEMERILTRKIEIEPKIFKFSPSLVGLTMLNSTLEAGFQRHKDYFSDSQNDPEFWFQNFDNIIKDEYQILNPRTIDLFLNQQEQTKYQVSVTGYEADEKRGILTFETTIKSTDEDRSDIVPLTQKWVFEGFKTLNSEEVLDNFTINTGVAIQIKLKEKTKYFNKIKEKLQNEVNILRSNSNNGEIDIMSKLTHGEIYTLYNTLLENVNYYEKKSSEVFQDRSNESNIFSKMIKKTGTTVGFSIIPTPMELVFMKNLGRKAIIPEKNMMELLSLKLVFENDDYNLKAKVKFNTRFIRSNQWISKNDNDLSFEPDISSINKVIDIPIRFFGINKN